MLIFTDLRINEGPCFFFASDIVTTIYNIKKIFLYFRIADKTKKNLTNFNRVVVNCKNRKLNTQKYFFKY